VNGRGYVGVGQEILLLRLEENGRDAVERLLEDGNLAGNFLEITSLRAIGLQPLDSLEELGNLFAGLAALGCQLPRQLVYRLHALFG